MIDTIFVINAGSSSVKFSLFERTVDLKLLIEGKVSNIGSSPSFVTTETQPLPKDTTHEDALRHIFNWIEQQNHGQIIVAVHRVVHGGKIFSAPVIVTPTIEEQLRSFNNLAPLHQPHNLAAIDIIKKLKPNLQQIACFDTAFHTSHDPLFYRYALPQKMQDAGIIRYGFHGLSYEWIAHTLKQDYPALAKGRVIVAHLGSGASLCAMKDCISIDTTMGMTALDGLPMGTRCGTLDPGAVIYMMRDLKIPADDVEHILYNESGLKGLSDITNDIKQLLASNDPKAKFAIDYFCLKTAQFISMMAVALGGIDGIIFTGGIGENAAPIRDGILSHIAFLQPFENYVITANEERIMAMHADKLL